MIKELRDDITGELSDRSRVIDHLLDLRLAAESPELVEQTDTLLLDMPGMTIVTNSWWVSALDSLEDTAKGLSSKQDRRR